MSIKMIATQTGFYRGARVRPTQEFDFYGDEKKLPKWAHRKDEPAPRVKARPINGDTKPEDAAKAAAKKIAGSQDLV